MKDRWLWLSMLLATGLSLLYYSGYLATDDGNYLPMIKDLAAGRRFAANLGSERLALLLPAVPIAWLTNNSNFAIIASYVIYLPITVYLVYQLGLLLHDRATARLAALITATSPLLFVYAGSIFPDVALTMWVVAALFASLRVLKGQSSVGGCMVTGLLVGLAYSTKQTGLLMAVPCGLAILLGSPRLFSLRTFQNGLAFVGTLALTLGAEQLLLRLLTGRWVDRSEFLFTPEMLKHFVDTMQEQGTLPWDRFAYAWKTLHTGLAGYRFAFLCAIPLYCLLFRTRAHVLVALTTVWLATYMTIGSVSFTRYLGGAILARYYAICIPMAGLMLAAVLLHFAQRLPAHGPRQTATVLAVACVVLLSWRAIQRHSRTVALASSTRAFAETFVVARRQYGELPLFASKYVFHKWQPLFHDDAPRAFSPARLATAGTETPGAEALAREFLLMRMGTEWTDELSTHFLELDAPGRAPLLLDPRNYRVERVYFSGDEIKFFGHLTAFRAKFLQDLKTDPRSPMENVHGAIIFLERWRRLRETSK